MAEAAALCSCSSVHPQVELHIGKVRNVGHSLLAQGAWSRNRNGRCFHGAGDGSNGALWLRRQASVRCCALGPERRPGAAAQAIVAGAGLGLLAAALAAGQALGAEEVAQSTGSWDMDFVIAVACVVEAVALVGAAVGGTLARQRKVELERINAQLRQINLNLRRQVRVESYAPGLKYAPVGVGAGRLDSPRTGDGLKDEVMQKLRAGKKWLREQKPELAFAEFEQGLALARKLGDPVEEKKAARGLGASCQRQGKYREAIKYHSVVLDVSDGTGEHSGDTEAYGAIADCYTELGDLETAAKFYDKYIDRLEDDN